MSAFLKEVAEDLVTRLGGDLHHAAVVFNNKRPVPYLQNHLADSIGKPFWSPSFFTIQEFFALSTHLQVADGFTQFFTLLQQYNKLLAEEGGKALNPDVFYPIARIILSDFSQIDNDLVNADQLFQELEDIAVIEKEFQHLTPEQQQFLEQFWSSFSSGKQQNHQEQFIRMWRRMPKLYRSFHHALREKGYTTMAYIYRQLAEGNADRPTFINDFSEGKLVFAGFNALSNAEAVIFKRWNKDEKALFYFDADNYYLQDETQEAGLFLRKNIQKLGLPNALGASKDLIRSHQKEINVYKTQGQTAQAKILQQELLQDYPLLEAADNAGKIALILADESLLLPVLQTIPTQYQHAEGISNIDLNVTMGYPLLATSIFGLADLWLSIQAQLIEGKKDTVYYREVEAFLSHPLTGVSAEQRDLVQQEILKEQLIEVPVLGLHNDELSTLFFTKVHKGLAAINNLQKVFRLILERQLEDKTLKQTEADLFAATLKELNRLHDTLEDYAAQLPLSFVLSLMQKAVQGIAVPLSGEPLQGVQVMGLLESRSLDFEHVYVLGVNEGILPQVNVSPSFIPDSIRRAYGLPVIENQDAISAYMFYRLLQRSKKVSLVYNGQGDDNNTGEPSRFLRQLEFESGYTFKYFDQSQSVAIESKVNVDIKKEGEVLRRLNLYLDGQEGPSAKLSATRLTTYLNCPVQFFYKYIAKIEEPEELAENLEANSIGSTLHLVLERFYQKLQAESPYITKERIVENRKNLDELCKRAFAFVMFKEEEKILEHNGMQQVMLAIVAEYANVILDHDENQAPFTLVELENDEDYVIPFPIKVQGEERSLTLFGIIDRVDQRNGVTRIVDYKTGRDEIGFSSIEELFDSESNKQNKALVQTLFYTYVYEQAKGITGVEPNLYIIRKMREEGTLFYLKENRKRVLLQAEQLDEMKGSFKTLLQQKLEELFNPDVPFTHTTVADNCMYCPYLTLCGK
ncbi:Exodeoxyribonuclease V, gamma subunit [Pedobacter steynii]|uniref:Exodeoxyribonuclease V, gamma subunit n=1 Tax=Pedobacter steynii TaxID=430522 RepID=A0A1H0DL58_9SPHI|nr:PD-(D/E)XK nuclease family protein [Pedobacter steynii]NQX41770.1 exodeoxyribonuclease V subunit gamma [Pedobacter steynii]SDN70823.1 Exodeoxyribonuclease V, gamma subunit [Pedobacter steynii]